MNDMKIKEVDSNEYYSYLLTNLSFSIGFS